MKSLFLLLSLFMSLSFLAPAEAWEVSLNFNLDDIKNRNIAKVLAGGVASVAVHETGHFLVGRALGMDTKYMWNGGPAVGVPDFYNRSETDRAIFAVAGMLSQSIVGTILTATANESDYTLGFNATSAVANLSYPFRDSEFSDWHNIPHGKLVCFSNGFYQSILTGFNAGFINID